MIPKIKRNLPEPGLFYIDLDSDKRHDSTAGDIAHFISHKLDSLPRESTGPLTQGFEQAIKDLAQKSAGLFVYAALAYKLILGLEN